MFAIRELPAKRFTCLMLIQTRSTTQNARLDPAAPLSYQGIADTFVQLFRFPASGVLAVVAFNPVGICTAIEQKENGT